MTDLFGPWDALLLLVVGLCLTGLYVSWKRRRARDVSCEWLRLQDGKDWTRGYEGVTAKWDKGARWTK